LNTDASTPSALTDEYDDRFELIEGFDLGVRNDFTLRELEKALDDGEEIMVDYLYPPKPGTDERGYSLTEKNSNGHARYVGRQDRDKAPIGYRLVEIEEFDYEGGVLKGFGTFKMLSNGNLGDGHEAWALVQHVESGRYFRSEGWYSSWDGGSNSANGWTEVEPAEVTVVRYKPLGKPDSEAFDNPAVTV
jgi:hypothetical protein